VDFFGAGLFLFLNGAPEPAREREAMQSAPKVPSHGLNLTLDNLKSLFAIVLEKDHEPQFLNTARIHET
jgi:hypothetical protein